MGRSRFADTGKGEGERGTNDKLTMERKPNASD